MEYLSKIIRGFPERWLNGRKVAVVGLGQSGLAVLKLLRKLGAKIFVSESQRSAASDFGPANKPWRASCWTSDVSAEFGGHTKKILQNDLIILSPGVPADLPVLKKAKAKNIPVWGELELGFRFTHFKQIAAITGTNGKTTTVSLLGDMCKRGGLKTLVAGNIGAPLCNYALTKQNYHTAVLEVSSYQLESIHQFHPKVSAILNLTSDHLHRHKTMANYAKAKQRIFMNQTSKDFCVLNADDPWCRKMARACRAKVVWFSVKQALKEGVYYDSVQEKIIVKINQTGMSDSQTVRQSDSQIVRQSDSPTVRQLDSRTVRQSDSSYKFSIPSHLLGLHNVENSCAAVACALLLGVQPSAIEKSVREFKAVEHRLEKVRVHNGITYINDSKATNVDSTIKAMESFDQPVWLILGGQDKGGSYLPIRSLISKKKKSAGPVKGIFLIGEAANKINKALQGSCPIYFSGDMKTAVSDASRQAQSGDVILLSPACASFDQYKNYEERGKDFKNNADALLS